MAGTDVARAVVLDDRYSLENVIGQGGMATVYRAHDRMLGRDVAVKLFPPVSEDADDLLRHQAEMRVLAQLSHPGLVTLYDAGSAYAGGPLPQTYLVMELVTGPTLSERLTEGPLAPHHTALIGRQVSEALAAVHAGGVVHRDVKPANILLVDLSLLPDDDTARSRVPTGPVVKLADFGIARLHDGARLTATGTTLGTATYLSPEQAAGSVVGPPTDVYALGLVLLECLTGRKAFTGTMVEVAAARLTTAPPIPDDLDQDWVELLDCMTRRVPDERFTAGEVAQVLTAILEAPTMPAGDRRRAAPFAGRRRARAATQDEHAPSFSMAVSQRRGTDDGTRELSTAELMAEAERMASVPGPRGGRGSRPASIAPSGGSRTARPGRWSRLQAHRGAVATAVAVVAGAGALLVGQLGSAEAGVSPPPRYPAVEGTIGDALTDLQQSVEP